MNIKKHTLALLVLSFILFSEISPAQTFKYWVKFTDKIGTPYVINNPSAFLSAKSIARRSLQGIQIKQHDLPVTPAYVNAIASVPTVTVLYRSKWLNGVVVKCAPSATAAINSYSFVANTNKVNKYKITLPVLDTNIIDISNYTGKSVGTATFNYAQSDWQQKMLEVECLHNMGYRGQNMTIAVIDDGFLNVHTNPVFDSLRLQNRLLGCRDFVTGDTLVFEDDARGTMVLSTMAGIYPGKIIGTAPKAKYWLLRSEDIGSETISEEYNWIRAAEFADSVGADICTTSLGYTTFDDASTNHFYGMLDGKTAPMSIAATIAARVGMLVFNAAGNDGASSWNFIGVPADADSICTVGAVDSLYNIAGFSSKGPTADGRVKPDLCARGHKAFVCSSWPSCFFGNGTSFATPILAGAAACLWQSKGTNKKAQHVLSAMRSSGTFSATPNFTVGWGVPKMCTAFSNTIFTLGIDDESEQNKAISISPNPFNNEISIQLNSNVNGNVSISIYDVLGKEVHTQKTEIKESIIRISNLTFLTQGFYFIRVSSSDFSVTKKVLKQ